MQENKRRIVALWILTLVTSLPYSVAQDEPVLPEIDNYLPSTFQADIQITSTAERSTYHGQVYYDSTTNQGKIIVENEKLKVQVIYNSDGVNNKTLLVQDQKSEGGLNEVPMSCTFFDNETRLDFCNELLLQVAFDSDLHFNPGCLIGITPKMDFQRSFEEQGIQIGLFVDDSLMLPVLKEYAVVESYWYLGDSVWNFPHCPKINSSHCDAWTVPIKTRISANSTCSNEKYVRQDSVEYVYYNYQETISDPTVFQIPQGVYCSGVDSTLPLPNLVNGFTTGMETISTFEKRPFSSTIYYDGAEKIVRVDDSFPANEMDPTLPEDALIMHVNDYNTGVTYTIDPTGDICVDVRDIVNSSAPQKLGDAYTALTDEDFNKADAVYVGKRTVRGIECDVWTLPLQHDAVLEIYVNEAKQTLEDHQEESRWIPVLYNVTKVFYPETISQPRSFYNFIDATPHRSVFDYMSTCIPDEFKKRFQIEIEGNHSLVRNNPEKFIVTATKEICDESKISIFRIEQVQLDYVKRGTTEVVLFTATMLEDIYIAGGLGAVSRDPSTIVTNDVAYDTLANKVYNGGFDFGLRVGNVEIRYAGVSIRDDIIATTPGMDLELFNQLYTSKGSLDLQDSGYDYQMVDQSLSSCAADCLQGEAVLCESFTFCSDAGVCKISHIHYDNMTKDQTSPNPGCQLYTRNYALDYKISRYTKVKPTEEEAKTPFQTATAEQCARQCSQNPDNSLPFFCEGFDVCQMDDKTTRCELRSRHLLDIPNEEIIKDKKCSHYSRNYVEDFLIHVNFGAEGSPKTLISDMSADACARTCATQEDTSGCKAFEMCLATETKKKTECRILEVGRNDPKVAIKPDTNCDFYSRERYGPPRHHHQPSNQTTNETDQPTKTMPDVSPAKRYTLAAMSGLGASMVIIGFLVGVGIMVLLMRFCGPRH